jgi:hypothetical protein
MSILPDDHAAFEETDREFWTRLDHEAATEKARLEATYPAYEPDPFDEVLELEAIHNADDDFRLNHRPYEPTPQDLQEMAAWSQNVTEHDDALQTWMDFFGGDHEEKSVLHLLRRRPQACTT